MSVVDFKAASSSGIPALVAVKAAVTALNTVRCTAVPSLGAKVTTYDVVRHLEHGLRLLEALVDAADAVGDTWEKGDLAGAVNVLCATADDCREPGEPTEHRVEVASAPAGPTNRFTVIGHYTESAELFAQHVHAHDAMHAFAVAAAQLGSDEVELTAAVEGHLREESGLWFPGDQVTDGETVLSQPEVFGSAEPTADKDGAWAASIVERFGVRLEQATEEEVAGLWVWIEGTGGSDTSYTSREEAALDALEAFAPFEDWQYEVTNGDTTRGYHEWAESKADQKADEIAMLDPTPK